MTKTKTLAVMVIMFLLLAGLGSLGGVELLSRVSGDEHRTCLIQQRGLPAGHALANVVSDLHFLVALPLTTEAKNRLAHLSPGLRTLELARYHDLSVSAARYTQLEAKQPAGRRC